MRITLDSGTVAELHVATDPVRGVVICPDMIGLRPLFVDLCERLAVQHSWSVCAVEPYAGREHEPVAQRLRSPMPTQLVPDLVAAADRVGTEPVAVLGFCLGGMAAMQAAGSGRFDRAVSFYGMVRVPEPWRAAGIVDPVDVLGEPGAAPVLALFGGRDPWTPAADIAALRGAPGVEVHVYPDADHAFAHDPERATYRPDDAADAWARVRAFLQVEG